MNNCVLCHADDGSGAMPGVVDLTENRNWLAFSNTQLLEHVNKGFKTPGSSMAMPPKGGNPELSDKDILSIIEFMRKEFKLS